MDFDLVFGLVPPGETPQNGDSGMAFSNLDLQVNPAVLGGGKLNPDGSLNLATFFGSERIRGAMNQCKRAIFDAFAYDLIAKFPGKTGAEIFPEVRAKTESYLNNKH